MKRACPPGPPCQLYATIPEDPAHAFFLNVHTHEDVSNVVVYYREVNSPNVTDFLIVNAESYEYHGLEWKERRKVHSALILGLKPNTKYLTIVSYNN